MKHRAGIKEPIRVAAGVSEAQESASQVPDILHRPVLDGLPYYQWLQVISQGYGVGHPG